MAKFDIKDLTESLNLKKIIDSVKSIITPGSEIPEKVEGLKGKSRTMAEKVAEISELAKALAHANGEQAKNIAELYREINSLYQVILLDAERKAEVVEPVMKKTVSGMQEEFKTTSTRTRKTPPKK